MPAAAPSTESVKLMVVDTPPRVDKPLQRSTSKTSANASLQSIDTPSPSITWSLATCALYGTTSVSITFFNNHHIMEHLHLHRLFDTTLSSSHNNHSSQHRLQQQQQQAQSNSRSMQSPHYSNNL